MNDLSKGNLNIKVVASIIAFVIVSGWAIVQKIILPINNIEINQIAVQAQLLQLQATLEPIKEVPVRLTNIEGRLSKLEAKK